MLFWHLVLLHPGGDCISMLCNKYPRQPVRVEPERVILMQLQKQLPGSANHTWRLLHVGTTGKCWKIRDRTSLISHSGVRSASLSSFVSSQYFFITRRTSNSSIWRFDFSYVFASTSITLNCWMGILDDDQILRSSFLTDSTDLHDEILQDCIK